MSGNNKVMIAVLVAALMISVAVGGVVAANANTDNGNTNDSTENQAVTAPESIQSVGTIINEVCPGDTRVFPVIFNKLDVYDSNYFYDVTDHSRFTGKTEAQSRIDNGHNVVQLPDIHDNAYVYFMSDGNRVCGPNLKVMYEAEGLTCLASVLCSTFHPYSTAPSSFWKIEDGHFVKVHPISDINLLNDLRDQLSQKQGDLASTDYQFKKYVDGVLTEEEYAPIKAQRVQLYSEIDMLKAQIAELLK